MRSLSAPLVLFERSGAFRLELGSTIIASDASQLGGVMKRYHFATCGVAGQDDVLLDSAGMVLEDDAAAEFYARRLARELRKTRPHPVGWTLVAREGERDVCFVPVNPS